jgi:hypothetical protein
MKQLIVSKENFALILQALGIGEIVYTRLHDEAIQMEAGYKSSDGETLNPIMGKVAARFADLNSDLKKQGEITELVKDKDTCLLLIAEIEKAMQAEAEQLAEQYFDGSKADAWEGHDTEYCKYLVLMEYAGKIRAALEIQ